MGSSSSRRIELPRLKAAEVQEFSKQTLFPCPVVEKLYSHFYRISSSQYDDGVIDLNEFSLSTNSRSDNSIIIQGLFHLFDANRDGVINFREFLQGLSTFNNLTTDQVNDHQNSMISAAKLKDQIEVSFRILDFASKKKIYLNDLKKILTSAVKENFLKGLSDENIDLIVDNTFQYVDYGRDELGKFVSFEDYSKFVIKNPAILKWLAADIERILQDSTIKSSKKFKTKCISV